jgi:hypothetical protein
MSDLMRIELRQGCDSHCMRSAGQVWAWMLDRCLGQEVKLNDGGLPNRPTALYAILEVLLSVLLACLYNVSAHSRTVNQTFRTLAGLPTFAPMTFHLFVSYSLMAVRRA